MVKSIRQVIEEGIKVLKEGEIPNPLLEAQLILAYHLSVDKLYIMTNYGKSILQDVEEKYLKDIKRRKSGMPLQYIVGKQEFMSMEFVVNENVLIPRPETEQLIEEVVSTIESQEFYNILEIGTGSGCIAVSLAKLIINSQVHTIDISVEATKIARENAALNDVQEKITFYNGNIFDPIRHLEKYFDIIISNPPYIPSNVIELLDVNVKDFEPRLALDGGEDGLNFYRQIVTDASKYLKNRGKLFFEIGYDQGEQIRNILLENNFDDIYVVKDFAGLDRIVKASLKI